MNQIIENAYYSASTGFTSAKKLYQKLIVEHPQITFKDVNDFVSNQLTSQVNKNKKKQTKFNSIVAYYPGENFQIDIIIYDRFEFNKYKYILVCIDVYSRYMECRPMKNRKNETIMKNLTHIFQSMMIPASINCDNEFNTKEFANYTKKNNISTYFSQANELNKNSIVERVNYTIAMLLQKWRIGTGLFDWAKILPQIYHNYNRNIHSTIKATPYGVFNHIDTNHQTIEVVTHYFNVGDLVRRAITSNVFQKGDRLRYYKESYTIRKIEGQKIYLQNNSTKQNLIKFTKPHDLEIVNDNDYESQAKTFKAIDLQQHNEIQQKKKVMKRIRKAGLDQPLIEALDRSARIRKPSRRQIESESR